MLIDDRVEEFRDGFKDAAAEHNRLEVVSGNKILDRSDKGCQSTIPDGSKLFRSAVAACAE